MFTRALAAVALALVSSPAFALYCGPNLATYYRENSASGNAVMCVRFVDRNSFAWFSQGMNDGHSFRLVGYSERGAGGFDSNYSSINGNGEQYAVFGTNPAFFWINDGFAWDENHPPEFIFQAQAPLGVWRLHPNAYGDEPIVELPPIRNCGQYLTTYRVQGTGGNSVRCVLASYGHEPSVWLGAGAWGATQYLHIGTAFFGALGPSYGASDICRPGFVCGTTRFGDLHLDRIMLGNRITGYRVTGAWSEIWQLP